MSTKHREIEGISSVALLARVGGSRGVWGELKFTTAYCICNNDRQELERSKHINNQER